MHVSWALAGDSRCGATTIADLLQELAVELAELCQKVFDYFEYNWCVAVLLLLLALLLNVLVQKLSCSFTIAIIILCVYKHNYM